MAQTLILYTTVGCHLCEQARDLLWPHLSVTGWQLQEVDIADSDVLIERYGVRIPVIARSLGNREVELGWPFTAEQLREFLDETQ